MITVSELFVKFEQNLFLFGRVQLLEFGLIVDDEGASLIDGFVLDFIVFFHFLEYWQIFLDIFLSFSQCDDTVSDLVDDESESDSSWL